MISAPRSGSGDRGVARSGTSGTLDWVSMAEQWAKCAACADTSVTSVAAGRRRRFPRSGHPVLAPRHEHARNGRYRRGGRRCRVELTVCTHALRYVCREVPSLTRAFSSRFGPVGNHLLESGPELRGRSRGPSREMQNAPAMASRCACSFAARSPSTAATHRATISTSWREEAELYLVGELDREAERRRATRSR